MRRQRNVAQIKENKTPEKEPNKTEIINLSDAEFKTLVIRMLRELTEYGKNRKEEMKVTLSEIKKNLQGTNSEGDEFGILCASWTCMSISLTKLGKFPFLLFLLLFLHPYDSDVGMFKDVPESSYSLLIFLNSCFLFCTGCMFIFSLCSKSLI